MEFDVRRLSQCLFFASANQIVQRAPPAAAATAIATATAIDLKRTQNDECVQGEFCGLYTPWYIFKSRDYVRWREYGLEEK